MLRATGLVVGIATLAIGMAASCSSGESGGAGAGGSGTGATGAGGGLDLGGNGGAGVAGSCAVASDEVVPSPVDVIFAIDQSASMGEEHQGVLANLNSNLTTILDQAGIDYRVIFVTGMSGLPTGPEYFQADVGVNSSDALTLLLWTYDGFDKQPNTCDKVAKPAAQWSGQLRYDSQKVFIVVSDDDPSSFDCAYASSTCTSSCSGCANGCAGYCPMHQCPTYADQPAAWGGADFPTELYKLAPAGMFGELARPKWRMHAIVAVDQQYAPTDPVTPLAQVCNFNGNTGETSGVEYQKLAVLTGGLRFPSCNTDYSPVFQSIAASIVPLACKFSLEQTSLGAPDPTKTNVEIDYGDGQGPQVVPKDDSAPCDGGADGWQFADNQTAVVLCGPACEKLKQSANATVSITVGCATVIR